VTLGQLQPGELSAMLAGASSVARQQPHGDNGGSLSAEDAIREAQRCLHCDCRKFDECKLRKYAEQYGADLRRYDTPRPPVRIERQHGGVIYEPGKCIDCGLCVRIAAEHGEPLGLTFIGRGFNMRPGVPFGAKFDEALTKAAQACVKACPTGALAFDKEK
jgi:NADH dehydrogenase/NADH:ubiquinone oxidoreductase subunit G